MSDNPVSTRITSDCPWCESESGLAINRMKGEIQEGMLPYYASCGNCLQMTPYCATIEEVHLIVEAGPVDPKDGTCFWCAQDTVVVSDKHRHLLAKKYQGFKVPMMKVLGWFFGMCSSCQSSTPLRKTEAEVLNEVANGPTV